MIDPAMSEDEIIRLMSERIQQAETRMFNALQEDLYGGPVDHSNFKYEPPTLKQKLAKMWWTARYFVTCRIFGVWSVLRRGECGSCERIDDDY